MLESLVQNIAALLEEGFIVMLAGMAVVFTFLVILVAAMFVMGAIVKKLNQLFPAKVLPAAAGKPRPSVSGMDEIAVAIAAVLNRR